MPLRSPVEKAIWFIESHFGEDITLDDVAGVCGLSRFQTSRLFSSTPAETMTGYLRARRLTEAARALAQGAPNILDVAVEAGYSSHEAFSRAFIQQFGVTPSQVRAPSDLDGLALVLAMRADPETPHRLAPPTVRHRHQLPIAGIERRFPLDDLAGIPSLWQDFRAFDKAIPGQRGANRYGVISDMSSGGTDYTYLAGVEVAVGTQVHDPLHRISLPARRWAAFTHTGHITTMLSTIRAIFAEALPAAGLTPEDTPDLVEVYRDTFDPWTGHGGVELWVPVRDR